LQQQTSNLCARAVAVLAKTGRCLHNARKVGLQDWLKVIRFRIADINLPEV
jgi:hypothetical protein